MSTVTQAGHHGMRRDALDRLARELAAARDPAISLTVPPHRHPPDNARVPIRVRQLARQATDDAGADVVVAPPGTLDDHVGIAALTRC